MLLTDIKPYVRYARYLNLDTKTTFASHIPYDARLFYTYEGSGIIEIGGTEYKMKEGCILIINSGIEYHLHSPAKPVTYLAVNFDYTFTHADSNIPIPPQIRKYFNPQKVLEHITFEDTALDDIVYIPEMQKLQSKLINIVTEYTHRLKYYELKISSMFADVLVECIRQLETPQFIDSKETTDEIIDYIHTNYKLPLTNKDIAEKFGFHPNYISSIIKQCTGLPLHQYLMHLRLLHAINLLDTRQLNISQVAHQSGFKDIYYFSRYFKKTMGITPTHYQKSSS